jgi:hypothetical protein
MVLPTFLICGAPKAGTTNPEDRDYLKDVYREPNAQLEEYLGRDLSH